MLRIAVFLQSNLLLQAHQSSSLVPRLSYCKRQKLCGGLGTRLPKYPYARQQKLSLTAVVDAYGLHQPHLIGSQIFQCQYSSVPLNLHSGVCVCDEGMEWLKAQLDGKHSKYTIMCVRLSKEYPLVIVPTVL